MLQLLLIFLQFCDQISGHLILFITIKIWKVYWKELYLKAFRKLSEIHQYQEAFYNHFGNAFRPFLNS